MTPTQGEHAQTALEDFEVRKLAAIGAVSTSSGLVERRPIEYRRELENQFVRGYRAAESRLHAQVAALTAAPAQPAAPQGGAYAELPEPALQSTQCDSTMRYTTLNSFSDAQMRAFADGTHALRTKSEASREFLERMLSAMEGVIDVADRQTDEFEALRSCVVDLTLMLFKPEALRASNGQAPAQPCAKCGDDKAQHNGARCVNGSENSYFTPTAQAAPAAGAVAGPTDATRNAWQQGYAQGVASALPSKVTPDMRRVFREGYREGGFWSDRLDYALEKMLAAAPTPAAQADSQPVPTSATGGDWAQPTTVATRLGDAMQLLCGGKRPPDELVLGWLDNTSEELQSFAASNGPAWAQGIGLIDAAMVMVDQPTEITAIDNPDRDHEHHEHRAARKQGGKHD